MKYFFNTEFIEGFKKPISWLPSIGLFNRPYHSIQLISIGIVAEDDREYYAISNEFNENDADDWVKKNVINKLEPRQFYRGMGDYHDVNGEHRVYPVFEKNPIWKSNKEIAEDIVKFVRECYDPPEFYAYFADYDWVVFCALFGRMIDLPEGFPMYCKDLKQMLDYSVENLIFSKRVFYDVLSSGEYKLSVDERLDKIKTHPTYPIQINEHSALDDARWNKRLYNFITKAL